jgi:hypothetical protein
MSYASLADVQALNPARIYTASSQPASAHVAVYLDNRAAELDMILIEKGYSLPVPTTASSALLFLRKVNAQGAWADVEKGAPSSPLRDEAQKAYDDALKMLKAANTVLDIPKDQTRASPRGPGLTTPNGVVATTFDPYAGELYGGANQQDTGAPFFARNMTF